MVYGMARQSGGTRADREQAGEGTAVKLYFRAARGRGRRTPTRADRTDGPPKATAKPRRCWSSTTIPTSAGSSSPTLEEQGYRVRQASDGEQGLGGGRARDSPTWWCSTSSCPGCPAPRSPARILAKAPDQPILFVSGYSETEAVKRTAPNAPLLAKPFRADALDKAVRAALASPS